MRATAPLPAAHELCAVNERELGRRCESGYERCVGWDSERGQRCVRKVESEEGGVLWVVAISDS